MNKYRWSGITLIHPAAENGHTDLCEILIKYGADLNCRSTFGWLTPLHLSLGNGYEDTALLLAENNADIWWKNKIGEDASTYAVVVVLIS